MKRTLIEYGKYYHIFNRGNNYENIFHEKKDYLEFLNLMDIFVTSIADVYAWALLGNHFHLLVRIKEEDEIGYLNPQKANSKDIEEKWKTYSIGDDALSSYRQTKACLPEKDLLSSDVGGQSSIKNIKLKKPSPPQQFKHFFNTYAKWYNRKYGRKGTLFIKNFERKIVDNEKYLRNLIIYIHRNPVHHGFTEHIVEYAWTSYLTMVSVKPTKTHRETVLGYFDDKANFKYLHKKETDIDFEDIEQFLIE